MVLYLQSQTQNQETPDLCQHYKKSFVFVDTTQRHLNLFQLKTIKGSSFFHCVENTGVPLTINMRENSCMCR